MTSERELEALAETLDAIADDTRGHSLNGEQHGHLRAAAEMIRRLQPARVPDDPQTMPAFDAGLLGDGGGGNVDWWHEYIRALLEFAHEHYVEQAALLSAAPAAEGGMSGTEALPMDTAPRDGTMVRLLVEFDEHDVEDSPGPSWTIGAVTNDEPDAEFQFAGWCWTHDHFTEGKGKPVGWLPMLSATPAPESREADENPQHCPQCRFTMSGLGWCVNCKWKPEAGQREGVEALEICRELVKWCDENNQGASLWFVERARRLASAQQAGTGSRGEGE